MISPGEKHLKRLVQERGTIRLKDVTRHPLFHGWDPESLRAIIDSLVRLGMVIRNGDILSVPMAARVAGRFLKATAGAVEVE